MYQFQCLECGKQFRTVRSAERASLSGCPKCGGVDIDLANTPARRRKNDRRIHEILDPVLGMEKCPICSGYHHPDECPERVDLEELEAAGEIYDRRIREEV